MKAGTLYIQTEVRNLNTGLVRYSDPHCSYGETKFLLLGGHPGNRSGEGELHREALDPDGLDVRYQLHDQVDRRFTYFFSFS